MLGLAAAGATIPTEGAVAGAVAGLKAAAVAVVAQAVVAMARRLTPDAPRIALAAGAGIVALAVPVAVIQPLLIVGGALVGWLGLRRLGAVDPAAAVVVPITGTAAAGPGRPRRTSGSRAGAGPPWPWRRHGSSWWSGARSPPASPVSPELGFLAALVRAGALVFGGGHVVLPLLDAGVVTPGWVTPDAFLAGYGAAQAVPGSAVLLRRVPRRGVIVGAGGVPGALLATVAIFLPGALLVLAALPVLRRLRGRPGVAAALRNGSRPGQSTGVPSGSDRAPARPRRRLSPWMGGGGRQWPSTGTWRPTPAARRGAVRGPTSAPAHS